MAKSSKETILHDEIKLMDALEQHAKENIDELAKRCGVSRQKVSRIIKRLEEKKIIWGYTAVTDETAKNLKHFNLLVKRTNVPFEDDVRKEVLFDKVDNIPSGLVKVENIYISHGMFDWIITFYAPDLVSAKKFVELLFNRRYKYIKEFFLIETLVPVRKHGLKNPRIKELVQFV
jgi:DNA-binding Lrp family transcriptional regulator